MLLILFRFAMCCICYKMYSVWHLFGRLLYIFSHCFVCIWKSDGYVIQLLEKVIEKSILVLRMLPFALWKHANQFLFVALLHSTHYRKKTPGESYGVYMYIHVYVYKPITTTLNNVAVF